MPSPRSRASTFCWSARPIFRSRGGCHSTTPATPISERWIKSRQPPQSAASPLGCISSRPRWTRTFSSRRGSSSSPCRGVPGRRPGSRTACPGSSANDGGPTESSTRSAARQHSPRSPIDKRRRLANSGTAAPYFSAAVRRQRCQPCRQPQQPYARRPLGVDLIVMGEFGEAFEDAEQVVVPRAAQDLHIAGAALRAERPEPRQLVAALRRRLYGKAAERAHQMLRLALPGLPWILAEPDLDALAVLGGGIE